MRISEHKVSIDCMTGLYRLKQYQRRRTAREEYKRLNRFLRKHLGDQSDPWSTLKIAEKTNVYFGSTSASTSEITYSRELRGILLNMYQRTTGVFASDRAARDELQKYNRFDSNARPIDAAVLTLGRLRDIHGKPKLYDLLSHAGCYLGSHDAACGIFLLWRDLGRP